MFACLIAATQLSTWSVKSIVILIKQQYKTTRRRSIIKRPVLCKIFCKQ